MSEEATGNGASCQEWTSIGAAAEVVSGELRTVKAGEQQLVVGRSGSGRAFALDNRCPHEGYPLSQGQLCGDQLTCCWHNWKFRVDDGRCLLGGEDVRAFALREVDGNLQVDLREPDPAEQIPPLRASLDEGIHRGELARAVRDGVRLLDLGYDPRRLLADVAHHDAVHAEYGTSHVLAVAVDLMGMLDDHPGVAAMEVIAPLLELCVESDQRLSARPRVDPPLEGGDAATLRAAIEAEDGERAEALLRGAVVAGVPLSRLVDWLLGAAADHFTDFGHQLIYLTKVESLLPHLEQEAAADVLCGLARSLVLATREDTLPYWSVYRHRQEGIAAGLDEVAGAARGDASLDATALRAAVVDGDARPAFDALWAAMCEGVAAPRLARVLVAASAERMLRFDDRHERDPDVAENWLWASHRFTFASAVRVASERLRTADAHRLLFQCLAFVNSGRPMDLPAGRRFDLEPAAAADLDELRCAISAREPQAAIASALALAPTLAPEALRRELQELALGAPLVRPIVLAHAIKTAVAALDEYDALAGETGRELPLAAAVRLLATPIQERRLAQVVRTSIRWVIDGVVPRKLTQ